jgi:hypothetical protein
MWSPDNAGLRVGQCLGWSGEQPARETLHKKEREKSMKQLVSVKVASAVIAGLGLTIGAVGAVSAATGSMTDTGRDSANTANVSDDTTTNGVNSTNVGVTNNNPQDAVSGNAVVAGNDDDAGDAKSGNARNKSDVKVDGTISYGSTNSGSEAAAPAGSSATIEGTGRHSDNTVNASSTTTTNQTNATNITVTNNNSQAAKSGDATVSHNENGGNATSGAASNASTVDTKFNVTY